MREYELVIDKALGNGLSPEESVPFNTQILSECLGFRCGRLGLEAYKELENPLPNTVDMYYSWPFPQFIVGEGYNILVVRDDSNAEDVIYYVSNDHDTVTYIFSIDTLTFGQGGLMEVADFGEYILMVNGAAMIYWDPTLVAFHTIVSSATIPLMKTICNFKGQAVGGNVVSAWHDCDETFYIWSKIGSIDFTPTLDNEAGYRRCPYGGEVYHTRRVGDVVIGYSSEGVTLISPVSSPAATFGFKELYDIGLINKGAVDGNLKEQVFIDNDYNIVKIGSEAIGVTVSLIPKVLGYKYYIEQLADEDIIVRYEPNNKNYYIGNSTKTFLLSPNGLTEIPQHPSAVWRRNKETYMLPETVDDFEPLIVTEVFNMEYAGQKTIATIESDAMLVESAQAAVDWANDLTTWGYSNYVTVNNMGIATIAASGNMFRFRLKFASVYSPFTISYIKARYKMTDLRGIRGVYAPPPRGQ